MNTPWPPPNPPPGSAPRPAPTLGPGWLAVAIGGGTLMLPVVLALITLSAPSLVAVLRPADSPAGQPTDRSAFRLSDKEGRVSVELPKTWWEATSVNAGEITTDENGEWIVPDLEASGASPRWLSLWLDRPHSGPGALIEQHRAFTADSCPDPFCTADPVTEVTVGGHPGLRQQLHRDDGSVSVITTIDTRSWMIFVMIDGEDTAAGVAESIRITDSARLLR